MIAAASVDWKLLLAASLLIALAMILGYRLAHRDSEISRTSFGFYIERRRFPEDEPPWPELAPPVERTLPLWAKDEPTVELPPEEPPA